MADPEAETEPKEYICTPQQWDACRALFERASARRAAREAAELKESA